MQLLGKQPKAPRHYRPKPCKLATQKSQFRELPQWLAGELKGTLMKALNVAFGVLVVAASLAAAPAALGSVLAAVAGLLLMASPALPGVAHAMPQQPAAPVVQVVRAAADPLRVFELDGGAGVVVFRNVDGKLVSRLYRPAQA